jgi:hypothetical protein
MEEIWKDYPLRKDVKVSNLGRVIGPSGKLLKLSDDDRGYLKCNYGKIHRLVAITFLPNPENKREVNHLDANGMNNNLSNLAWVTKSENERYKYDVMKRDIKKISDEKILEIDFLLRTGLSIIKVAKETGINKDTVLHVKKRYIRKELLGEFSFNEGIVGYKFRKGRAA